MSAPRSKIIVRNFPPGFTDGEFRELVTPWIEAVDYIHFDEGKKPKPLSTKPVIFGRGYLNFKDSASLLDACQRLSGHHIVDADGFEGVLEASLAPYQGVPGQSQADPLLGTIESTPEWTSFLSALESSAHPTAIPIDKQAELMLAKERELNPWKYEKGLAKQTPLLVHLKKQATTEISLKGLVSTTGGGKSGKSGKKKKKASGKSGKSGKADDDIYSLPQTTSAAPLAPTKAVSTAKKTTPKANEYVFPSNVMVENAFNSPQQSQALLSQSVHSQQPVSKPKSKPKPRRKPAQSVVEPVAQAPVVPLKIMSRPADAKPVVQPKVVSTKPSSNPTGPAATGNMTTYSSASKTVKQYSSKAFQSSKSKTTPRPAE